jgi:NADH-quinone oxidoreductase subunit B
MAWGQPVCLDRFVPAPFAPPPAGGSHDRRRTVTFKMAERLRRLWEQMAEPRYVMAWDLRHKRRPLSQTRLSVVKGVDQVVRSMCMSRAVPPGPSL